MKRTASLLLLICSTAIATNARAQLRTDTLESVGFSNSDHIDIIRDYRLPDWGYSNFWLDFSFSEDGFISDSDHRNTYSDQPSKLTEEDRYSNDIKFNFAPRYNLYRESERRIFNLSSGLSASYRKSYYRMHSARFPGYNRTTDTRRDTTRSQSYNTNISLQKTLRFYFLKNWFLYGHHNIRFEITYDESDSFFRPKLIKEEYNFTDRLSLGFGFGRVRNVTPTVRAVRLHDRLAVVSNQNLTNRQIQAASRQFTRINGYQRRFDRYQKYFWGDMFQKAEIDRNKMSSAFDLFYLRDVLNENLGSRREGWEARIFGRFDYQTGLDRSEDYDTDENRKELDRSFYVNKRVSWHFRGRWYHNLSLHHQLGLTGSTGFHRFLDYDMKYRWVSELTATWLYSISDRLLLNSSLTGWYRNQYFERDSSLRYKRWNVYLREELNYFIENHLALNASLTLSYIANRYKSTFPSSSHWISYLEESQSLNWDIAAGIKYYFYRNLY